MAWEASQILALAPDPASAKAGQGLASGRKWVVTGGNSRALWGECQGSGAKPYQTQIDLSEPAFKCSCPSRKFPCKHGLGLFLMMAATAGTGKDSPPQWVSDWLAGRDGKAEKKKEKAAAVAEAPPDPEAAAKRITDRTRKVSVGILEAETWLEDLIRQGLAHAQTAGDKHFEQMAARMVDSQSPGVARVIREMGELTNSGPGWHERVLARAGRLLLLIEAFKRIDALPPELQADVRTQIGFITKEEELLPLPAVVDTWTVIGQRVEEDDKLRTQRSWLHGKNTGKQALILEFAYGAAMLKSTLLRGSNFEAELIFYPGNYPLRAIIKDRRPAADAHARPELKGYATMEDALAGYSDALARNPWIEQFPMLLEGLRPIASGDTVLLECLMDTAGRRVTFYAGAADELTILALSGGHPVGVFGEWDGALLRPLSVMNADGFHSISARRGVPAREGYLGV